jgi:hypothetical protein
VKEEEKKVNLSVIIVKNSALMNSIERVRLSGSGESYDLSLLAARDAVTVKQGKGKLLAPFAPLFSWL